MELIVPDWSVTESINRQNAGKIQDIFIYELNCGYQMMQFYNVSQISNIPQMSMVLLKHLSMRIYFGTKLQDIILANFRLYSSKYVLTDLKQTFLQEPCEQAFCKEKIIYNGNWQK